MITSLYTGVSGINTSIANLSIVGNNIANMSTYGFKGSKASFADVINNSLSGISGSNSIGLGVKMATVAPRFTQGAFETSDNALDMAVDGKGFFILKHPTDNSTFYSRNGQFLLNNEGYITNQAGLLVQGYQVDGTGEVMDSVGNMQLSSARFPPEATAEVTVAANLNADMPLLEDDLGVFIPFDINDPDATSNFSTTVTVYDSLGTGHPISIYFQKTADDATGLGEDAEIGNTWEWYATYEDENGDLAVGAHGDLAFSQSGSLIESGQDTRAATENFNFPGGAVQDQVIDFSFGNAKSAEDNTTGMDGVTQLGYSSEIYALSQNGYESGTLQGISINEKGILEGVFTNGKRMALGQFALANFQASEGLVSAGQMLYSASPYSGEALVGKAGDGGYGIVRPNTLELSNVDLAGEFVRMITAQRGFQANSKVITTTDEVLMELVNLKR